MRAHDVVCLIVCLTRPFGLVDAAEPDRFADVIAKSSLVGVSVYLLEGASGNIAVSVDKDASFGARGESTMRSTHSQR